MNSIIKLDESTPNKVPSTFEELVLNIFEERNTLVVTEKPLFGNVFTLENDLTACIVMTVLMEKCFVLERNEGKSPNFDRNSLKKWTKLPPDCRRKDDCCYKFVMYLPFLEDYVFTIILVPLCGDTIVVNLVVRKHGEVEYCPVQLIKPSRHLTVFNPGVAEKFTNQRELSDSVGRMVERVKVLCLNAEGVSNPSLLGLPREVKEKILLMLPPASFLKLVATCKGLNVFAKDPKFWKEFLKREFKVISTTNEEYELFKEMYRRGTEEVQTSTPPYPTFTPDRTQSPASEVSLPFDEFHYMSLLSFE